MLFPSCGLSLSSVSVTKRIATILHTCASWNVLKCRLPSEQANCCPLYCTLLAKCDMCPFFVRSPKYIWNSFCSPSVCPSPVQTSDRCELQKSARWVQACQSHAKQSQDDFESQLSEPLLGRCCYPYCMPGRLSFLVGKGGCIFGCFPFVVWAASPQKNPKNESPATFTTSSWIHSKPFNFTSFTKTRFDHSQRDRVDTEVLPPQ